MLNKAHSRSETARKLNQVAASFWTAFIAVFVASTFHAFPSQSLVLAWDTNDDAETAGYFLHAADAAGNPLSKSDVGINTTATVSGLIDGGAYVFYVTAYDGSGLESGPSNKITYQIGVINVPPTADSKSAQMLQDQSLPVVLSGSDQNGDALTYSVVTSPTRGALSGATPNLTYTPIRGFYGNDSFTYVANDGKVSSTPAVVSITVQHVNHAPIANAKSIQTLQDQTVAVTLSGSDSDGDALTFAVVSNPAHGTLSGTLPNLSYTPAAGYSGTDSFTYVAKDGTLSSAPATVSITVQHVNHAPIADAKNIQTLQDQTVAVTLSGSDSDGDTLTFTVMSNPAHGTLSGALPNLSYTPAAGYSGTDSFTYVAKDVTLSSAPATVTITIQHVNHAPIADAKNIQTLQDQTVAVTLSGSDSDGDTLTFAVVSNPAHGTLSGTLPNLSYTPAAGYSGTDSFTYVAKDGTLSSAPATVSITIQHVNHAPIADAKNIQTLQDQTVAVTLSGSDSDGDTLTFAVVSNPAHGTLSGTLPNLSYTPAAGYSGTDSFTYVAKDATLSSALATVTITIQHVNHAPIADAKNIQTLQDQTVAVTLSGSDSDGDALTFAVVSNPAHGTLSGTLPNLSYTPAAGYYGTDTFTYTANDGAVSSAPATVTITVQHVNHAPIADAKNIQTLQDQTVAVTLSGSDSDGDTLTFAVVSNLAYGTLSGTPPNLSYTPAAGYYGTDSFTYLAKDGTLNSAPATVSITIQHVNHAPIADAKNIQTLQDQTVAVTLSGSDSDGDTLTFTVVSIPAHGTLSGTLPNLSYTPAAGYSGTDSFTYVAKDGTLSSAPATVSITIQHVNHAPIADAKNIQTLQDQTVAVTLSGSDSDGDALTFAVVSNPAHGTLSGTPPNLSYTPAAGYYGTDTFTYAANDGAVSSTSATVRITVQHMNHAPVANAKSVQTLQDQKIAVALSGSDSDGDALTFTVVSNPAHGTLSGSAPNLIYTPSDGFAGTDMFTYQAKSGTVTSDPATVVVTVGAVNAAPVAKSKSVLTVKNYRLSIVLSGQDPEGAPLSFQIITGPSHGTLTGTAPNIIYTPALNYTGPESFTFVVSDGELTSAPASVNISVTGVTGTGLVRRR